MGVDAEMLVRIRGKENWLNEEEVRHLSYKLASSVGHDQFSIVWPGEFDFWPDGQHALEIVKPFVDEYNQYPDLVGKVIRLQDGPPLVADEHEQFVKVNLSGRYYGKGYERGNWPVLKAIAEWLEIRIPAGSLWYGGDSSGILHEPLDAQARAKLTWHWTADGRRPYVHAFGPSKGVECPFCKVELANCGGGRDFDFLSCDGCGRRATKHRDGRLAWADNRHKDYPIFNETTGEVEQRKREW